jgi:hypothetical protein
MGKVPKIGMVIIVRGVPCRIFKIHPFGTIDVMATDGSELCWRLTGLRFLTQLD